MKSSPDALAQLPKAIVARDAHLTVCADELFHLSAHARSLKCPLMDLSTALHVLSGSFSLPALEHAYGVSFSSDSSSEYADSRLIHSMRLRLVTQEGLPTQFLSHLSMGIFPSIIYIFFRFKPMHVECS